MTTPCRIFFTGTNPLTSVQGTLTDIKGRKACSVPIGSQALNPEGFTGGESYQSDNFFTIGADPPPGRVEKTPENTCYSASAKNYPPDSRKPRVVSGPFDNSGILTDKRIDPWPCVKQD
jgi:hypothetical protein